MTNKKNPQLPGEFYKVGDIDNERYYMLPKSLFRNTFYRNKQFSTTAKVIYALLHDRMQLSRKNGWIDENGRIYLLFKQEDIENELEISHPTCVKAMKKLEELELIEIDRIRTRDGMRKTNVIYLRKLRSNDSNIDNSGLRRDVKKINVGSKKNLHSDVKKVYCNDTEYSETEYSETEIGGGGSAGGSDKNFSFLQAFKETFNRNANNAEIALLRTLNNQYSEDFVLHALNETALQHASSLKYTAAILKRWSEMHSLTPWLTDEKEKRKKQAQKSNTTSGIDAVNKLLEEFS